jgi:uncharacterized protein YecE (DUF72 family)
MHLWRIGCSGFYYSEWKNVFYPESITQRKWFEFYCEHFNTVELNVTFYRFPKLDFFKSWYNRSPDDFNFSVKAPRVITHYKRFKDAQNLLNDFYECVGEGLREKAGGILFQFPASFVYNEDTLNLIIGMLDKSYTNVLEFRHASWWDEKVYSLLRQNSIAFCGMSHPMLSDNLIQTTDTIYYRFHGVPQLYYSVYEKEELQQLADKISGLNDVKQVYIYFNNTALGSAIVNAKQIQEYCQVMVEGKIS